MYQAHLERIADFLQIPNIWHETEDGIMFDDLKDYYVITFSKLLPYNIFIPD